MPTVSVIMASYNYERFVAAAVESVLNQTQQGLELLVADSSTDGSRELLAGYACQYPNVRVFHMARSNAAKARNAVLRHARGAVIAYLDADDLYAPSYLATSVAHLCRNPTVAAVCSDFWNVTGRRAGALGNARLRRVVNDPGRLRGIGLFWNTLVHRRECLDTLGGFDEGLDVWEGADFILRLRDEYGLAYIPIPLYYHTVHGQNSTLTCPTEPRCREELRRRRLRVETARCLRDRCLHDLRSIRAHRREGSSPSSRA